MARARADQGSVGLVLQQTRVDQGSAEQTRVVLG